jgi:gamma-glutamylcyclotransferase (GGCT)/AIG2-like uncharacterized protein YtfP
MALYFVYGTLKKGFPNHHFLGASKLVSDKAWVNAIMFDLRSFPACVLSDKGVVFGELYEVTDPEVEDTLDRLEGVDSGFYTKEKVECLYLENGESKQATVIMYTMPDVKVEGYERIRLGEWK